MAYDERARRAPAGPPPARRGGGVPDALLVGTLAFLVGITALTWTATGLAGWLRHGAWPPGVTFLETAHAMRSFLTAPGDVAAAWPEADPAELPGAAMLWLVFLAQVVLLFTAVLWVSIRVARWRAGRHPAGQVGPAAEAPPEPVGPWNVPDTYVPDTYVPAQELPPREAPAAEVPVERAAEPEPPGPLPEPRDPVAAVQAAPPGLVVLDPDGRLWAKTARQRGRHGPVHVYDPGHVTDAPVRLRWAPQRGCEDMAVARARANALLAPVRPTEPIFQLDAETAETLLRCYLHAAALAGEPITQIHRWAHGRSGGEPGKILRTHARAAGGAAMELESTLTGHPGRRDAALGLIGRALSGLDQLHIRQACSPGRVDALALDNVAGEGGTLYVVGDHKETAGLRGALVAAMTADQPGLEIVDIHAR
ncbi:type IV secretory system conjugative DNA transfer family protein [Streptomyces johnsoniae]|uniref:Type VI secretion protein n=1 Tax=Streptomyces johnsoniae TaxID=3075532 RepID=A0ABU2S2W1_9ACTN|nr:type VI secretion protein [Streptomyces sp. DSM 41886]MDT0443334.1 type VI secretion protein [Streptomyces sp. DSM 41886]